MVDFASLSELDGFFTFKEDRNTTTKGCFSNFRELFGLTTTLSTLGDQLSSWVVLASFTTSSLEPQGAFCPLLLSQTGASTSKNHGVQPSSAKSHLLPAPAQSPCSPVSLDWTQFHELLYSLVEKASIDFIFLSEQSWLVHDRQGNKVLPNMRIVPLNTPRALNSPGILFFYGSSAGSLCPKAPQLISRDSHSWVSLCTLCIELSSKKWSN